ncbi:MAG: Bcr/CflA family efflux MFS transporter [Bradyrhizobiaceae bacterium]|nr:MAG: Bcr/CflA family efflux MFS transporter [Bradyrhizobiaceae bacterium]
MSPATADPSQSRTVLMLLVVMNGVGPVSLYLLVPVLPLLAKLFDAPVSAVQLSVVLFMIGLAISQLITGPLSDRFGRRPVLLGGLGLGVAATIACIFAQTLPQLVVARFFQALGGATGMVMCRAIIRDIYPRQQIGGMIALVTAVMMIAQMISPLIGGALDIYFGWHSIFYFMAAATLLVTSGVALGLPETRRRPVFSDDAGFFRDVRALSSSRAFISYALCQMLASAIIFIFAGGGPYIVVDQMARSTAEYGLWYVTAGFSYMVGNLVSVRLSPRHGIDRMIWLGLAVQITGAIANTILGVTGINQSPSWLFGTHMIITFGNAFVMSNASAGAISVRPQAAGTAAGIMGFLQFGCGSLFSELGAFLGGNFTTPLPVNIAILFTSMTCAAVIVFILPRNTGAVSEETMIEAEESEAGIM